MYSRIALMIGATLIASPSIAGQITVGDLQRICSGNDIESNAACRFYILGVTDGYAEGIGPRAGDPRAYCVPPNTSSVAMQDTVAAAINDDVSNFPKDRQLPATSLISAVLSRTFPCVKEPD